MSLFGDLPQAKDETGGEPKKQMSWSSSSLMQPVIRKPGSQLGPPPSVLMRGSGRGQGPSGRGGIAGGRGLGRGSIEQSASGDAAGPTSSAIPTSVSASSIFGSVNEEYDPARPNDYEEDLEGSAPTPPEPAVNRDATLNISGEEAFARRARLSGRPPSVGASESFGREEERGGRRRSGTGWEEEERGGLGGGNDGFLPPPPSQAAAGAGGKSLAQKLLEKMGWKEGDGLGSRRQGMTTPLMAQKTDKRSGLIVSAEANHTSESPAEKKQRTGAAIQGKPSRVICLRNMVVPGEVDEELEDEVGNELMKYGNVESVMIFEVTTAGYSAEEAVRIFVEDRFQKTDLAPHPGEFDS
eukprot:gene30085-35046_t